jgi:hypothetical protein
MPPAFHDDPEVKFTLGFDGRTTLSEAPEGQGEAPNYGVEFHSRFGELNANSTRK